MSLAPFQKAQGTIDYHELYFNAHLSDSSSRTSS